MKNRTLTLTVEEAEPKKPRSPHRDCDCGGKCPVCIAYEKMVKLAEEEFLRNFFRGTLQR